MNKPAAPRQLEAFSYAETGFALEVERGHDHHRDQVEREARALAAETAALLQRDLFDNPTQGDPRP